MKIVINTKAGGDFNLSFPALIRLDEIGGKVGRQKPYDYYNGAVNEAWEKVFELSKDNGHIPVVEGEDGIEYILWDHYANITDEKLKEYRSCPQLVRCVEELGRRASGPGSDLQAVEIPDDIEWEFCIQEGKEWIAEKHRKWYGSRVDGVAGDGAEFKKIWGDMLPDT